MEIKNNQINLYQYINSLIEYLTTKQDDSINTMEKVSNTSLYINANKEVASLSSARYPEYAKDLASIIIKNYKPKPMKAASDFVGKILLSTGSDIDGDVINLWVLIHTYDKYRNNRRNKISILNKIKSFFKKFRR